MALIRTIRGFTPKWGEDCFLAETATVLGDVILGDQCSVWYNAVIRGDVNEIRIGNQVNIQDGAVIHCTYEKTGTYIGNHVSIGHLALVHGCTLEDNVLVGMGAIVMDNVVAQSNCLIAAGAVVLEKTILESGFIYAGVPAKKVKELDPETAKFYITRTAANYVAYAEWFRNPG
ncbi:MAG: gamma carbonic anhydrase family protein [Saprospiraceae bacterium]|nr:gamma carbonic anhydrase family protein [Saprospiraceae bacterium]MCB9319871.1 gamma carbonic anhydrase family protein [Lewinellaceae bacterium]HPR01586.1 gamma carbonic anhydrase family protein [Saprospiraceae bacterium]